MERKALTRRKIRPRQQQCRSNVRLCCQNGNNVERVLRRNFVLSTKSNVASTLLLVWTGLKSTYASNLARWFIPFRRLSGCCADVRSSSTCRYVIRWPRFTCSKHLQAHWSVSDKQHIETSCHSDGTPIGRHRQQYGGTGIHLRRRQCPCCECRVSDWY